jgi:2-oxoisovalerate dehydrogenase E1 component
LKESLTENSAEKLTGRRPEEMVETRLVRKAFGIRLFEECLLRLFSGGKLFGTVHTCIGQEWSGIAVAEQLLPGDVVFSNHRCHGHYLARTENYRGLLAEIMGRASGICGGRGGSQHICDGEVFSNGLQGGIVPISAGIAMAQKAAGAENITVVFIGDGTLGEGVVYETLNIASRWSLPLLIVLENNSYAQSTPQKQTLAGGILARAEAFGVATDRADTWNVPNLLLGMDRAVSMVRNRCKPMFFELETYRLMAHSKGDDDRDPCEVREFRERDFLVLFERKFPAEAEKLKAELQRNLDAAVLDCEASSFATARPATETEEKEAQWSRAVIAMEDRVVSRIYAGLRAAMEKDSRILILGEDVEAPYGGAFKVTKDLSQLFPGRVRNTPISEAAILGLATGLAMRGMRPVCEFMFGDFLLLAADQFINHAAKFNAMYNGQVRVPVIVRAPMGGRRGYGATHSQSLEKHFLGIPDTQILALHHRVDPAAIYETLLGTVDRPTLVVENKMLYGENASAKSHDGFEWMQSDQRFPVSHLRAMDAADLSFLCYGGMLLEVEKAVEILFEEHDVIAEIVCPVQIYPLQIDAISSRISADRVIIVEEGQGFCGLGAELAAQLHERRAGRAFRAHRIVAAEEAIPACKPLELEFLPGARAIVQKTIEYLRS